MQDVKELYSIQESAGSMSLKPHAHLVKHSQWLLVAAVLIAGSMPVVAARVSENISILLYGLSIYLMLHGLYDVVIRANIRYTFDLSSNGVFENSLFHRNKRLMRLDEALVFVSEDTGSWHYALGAKKSQFVKSYAISEQFSSGYKSQARLLAYENNILDKIHSMIGATGVAQQPL